MRQKTCPSVCKEVKKMTLKVKRWPKNTIAAGCRHTVALKSDGTVTAVGDNKYDQCHVGVWRNIVAVAAGNVHMAPNTGNALTIGLRSDGTEWHLWVGISMANAM
jgi:alpha-tubulin suppressor-like RCC1 family protein